MGRMEKLRIATAGLLLAAAPVVSQAVVFNFITEFSASGDTCGGLCATLSVEQNGANVDFVLTAALQGPEKITSLYGNIDPYKALTPSLVGGTYGGAYTFNDGTDGDDFKADGDGDFDWRFEFPANPPMLDGNETFSWTFANTSIDDIIDALSVNGPVGKNGFTFAMHVQGLGTNDGSGWFAGVERDDIPVPEPSTLALLGLALGGLGLARRRR